MVISNFKLRIDGVEYTLRFTKQRQFFNGVEKRSITDHDKREIRVNSDIRARLVAAVSAARAARPHDRRRHLQTPKHKH